MDTVRCPSQKSHVLPLGNPSFGPELGTEGLSTGLSNSKLFWSPPVAGEAAREWKLGSHYAALPGLQGLAGTRLGMSCDGCAGIGRCWVQQAHRAARDQRNRGPNALPGQQLRRGQGCDRL